MERQTLQRNVAITVWEDRVSPVFDAAHTLLIAQTEASHVVDTQYHRFDPTRMTLFIELLKEQNVTVLVCGAVSEEPAQLVEGAGVTLIPFIAGSISAVLKMLVVDRPMWSSLKMPGCGKSICCRGKIRRGQEIQADQIEPAFKYPS